MARRSVPEHESPQVERLLRSLVGVADLHVSWGEATLDGVHILREPIVQHHQVIRNVVSGLRAGFGVALPPDSVTVHDTPDTFMAAAGRAREERNASADTPAGDVHPAASRAPTDAPAVAGSSDDPGSGAPSGKRGNGRGAGAQVGGNGGGSKDRGQETPRVGEMAAPPRRGGGVRGRRRGGPAEEVMPAPGQSPDAASATVVGAGLVQLERIDVERNASLLRCRAVLLGEGIRYSAIAEAPYTNTAEMELAARVTLDALRAGSLTAATLDGVSFLSIGATRYVAAAVRAGSAASPQAGTALVVESAAWAAALAVLDAVAGLEQAHAESRVMAPAG